MFALDTFACLDAVGGVDTSLYLKPRVGGRPDDDRSDVISDCSLDGTAIGTGSNVRTGVGATVSDVVGSRVPHLRRGWLDKAQSSPTDRDLSA